MATRRFADRDAPSLLRDLLGSLSVNASHAVGPLEYRAGMDRLARDVVVENANGEELTVTNDEVLTVAGKRLLRKIDSAADDAFVFVEPRIGPSLSLSRLDFRRGNAHLLGLLTAWRAECAKGLEFARAVTDIVRRSILGGGGIIALVGKTPKCRIVTDCVSTPLYDKWDVLSVVVGPRAVASAVMDRPGRPELADLASGTACSLLFYKGKLLPVLNDLVSLDIVQSWFLEKGEDEDEDEGEDEDEDEDKDKDEEEEEDYTV